MVDSVNLSLSLYIYIYIEADTKCGFKLHECYCVHFWTKTLGKRYESPYPISYRLSSIKYPSKVDMPLKKETETEAYNDTKIYFMYACVRIR